MELNADAVRDAVQNARCNQVDNIRFYCNDATKFMCQMAEAGDTVDVVFMDPPRMGSTEEFIRAVAAVKAKKVVYVSCGPDTLARDLEVFGRARCVYETAFVVENIAGHSHSIRLEAVPNGMYVSLPIVPNCIYTEPEIATVGITEQNANNLGMKVRCGVYTMDGNGKSIIAREEHGFIRLIFEAY